MNKETQVVEENPKFSVLDALSADIVHLEDSRYAINFPKYGVGCEGSSEFSKFYQYNGGWIQADADERPPVTYEIIKNKEDSKRIDAVRLTMHCKMKLGDYFLNLPYGVIKKNTPGIGATTLALQQQNNTIIVVPTRALAYAKYITGYNEDKTQNKYFYVGSDINECRKPTDEQIYEYITRKVEQFAYKKVIVVADSLGRVMKQLKFIEDAPARLKKAAEKHWEETHTPMEVAVEDLYSHSLRWYLMVDEIDSYQSDGVFRPAMENVIDYYFAFPPQCRCLVSATIRPFSNPQLQDEPVLEFNYEHPDKRTVELINTNNIHMTVCEFIRLFREKYPENKMVIAYNSITSIRKIIALLPEELQAECAIACSPDSREKAGDYFTVFHSRLINPITFITCSYFIGVDIKERFHLISVSDIKQIYTLLSKDKLYQISGRCRHKEGLLSETIIYNSTDTDEADYGDILVKKALSLSEEICELSNVVDELHKKHPKLLSEHFLHLKDDIVDRTKQSYFGSSPIDIVRVNRDGKMVPAYFNIDAIAEYAFLRGALYSNPEILSRELEASCTIGFYDSRTCEITKQQEQIEDAIDKEIEKKNAKSISEVIEKLKELRRRNDLTDISIAHLRRERHREDYRFIDRFAELYKYVPFDVLVARLQEGNAKSYNGFMRGVKYLALSENHLFKLAIKDAFKLEQSYTADAILVTLNSVFVKMDIPRIDSSRTAVQELNNYCTTTRSRGTNGNFYTIKAHRPGNHDFEPLSLIPDIGMSLRRYFDY